MKAISLTQPWATLVAIGQKKIETRSWATAYRGWLLIHAAKGFPAEAQALCGTTPFLMALRRGGVNSSTALPRGAIVAVANLHHVGQFYRSTGGGALRDGICIRGKPYRIDDPNELAFGDFTPGRYGFILTNVHPLPEPVLCRGALSVWVPPPEALARVQEQLPWLR